jgi:hypothetical protein
LLLRGEYTGHIYDDMKLDECLRKFLDSGQHIFIAHRRPKQEGALGKGEGEGEG